MTTKKQHIAKVKRALSTDALASLEYLTRELDLLEGENDELREALEKIAQRHCGGYVMDSQGYVNGCGCPTMAQKALVYGNVKK